MVRETNGAWESTLLPVLTVRPAGEYSSATSIAYVSRMSGQGVLPSHVHLDRWFVCPAGEYSPAG